MMELVDRSLVNEAYRVDCEIDVNDGVRVEGWLDEGVGIMELVDSSVVNEGYRVDCEIVVKEGPRSEA